MPFVKDVNFEVQVKQKKILSFHDITGINWSYGNKLVVVTIGSWEDKGSWGVGDPPERASSIQYPNIESFAEVASIIEKILNDQNGDFFGGTVDK